MNQLGPEFRVGVFTLLGLAATSFAVFVVSPDLFERDSKNSYYTILADASGILPKTHVKTNGVNVGKVKKVSLDNNATKVVFEIRDDVKIPKGSRIEIRTVGFLGDRFLEIKRTDDLSKGFVAPGEIVPREEDAADLQEVIALVGSIAKDIKKVTKSLAGVLGDEKGERSIQNIVDNIEDLTREAKDILQENRGDVRTLVANLKDFSASANEILDAENKERIDKILANFDDSMVEVKGATQNINLISEKIEKGEGTIGRLVNEDETLEELEGAIKDIRKVLAPVNQLKVEVDYHGEMRADQSSQNYFNLNFLTRPGNYYVLGFTDAAERLVDTVTEQVPVSDNASGTKTRTKEYIKDRKSIRFNAQIARRWHFAAIRFGLFESTGGIAGDFYALNDKIKFTLEAFDFADKDAEYRSFAHLKAYGSALFYNHIYTLAGIDDPTKKDLSTGKTEDLNYFVGAGVKFTDDDLRALFGLAAVATSP